MNEKQKKKLREKNPHIIMNLKNEFKILNNSIPFDIR